MLFIDSSSVIATLVLLISVVIVEDVHSASLQKRLLPLTSGLDPLVLLNVADPESDCWRRIGAGTLRHQKHSAQSPEGADQQDIIEESSVDHHRQSSASSEIEIASKPSPTGVQSSLKSFNYPSPARRIRFNPTVHYKEPGMYPHVQFAPSHISNLFVIGFRDLQF